MGGSRTVYWMIDPKYKRQRAEPRDRVGWATTTIGGAGPGNTWDMVPVWASARWDLGNDKNTREKVISMYYFQNDYGRSRPSGPGFLDVPGSRPRASSETRYTVVETQTQSWERDQSRDRSRDRSRDVSRERTYERVFEEDDR